MERPPILGPLELWELVDHSGTPPPPRSSMGRFSTPPSNSDPPLLPPPLGLATGADELAHAVALGLKPSGSSPPPDLRRTRPLRRPPGHSPQKSPVTASEKTPDTWALGTLGASMGGCPYPASALLRGSPPLSGASVLSSSRLEPLVPCMGLFLSRSFGTPAHPIFSSVPLFDPSSTGAERNSGGTVLHSPVRNLIRRLGLRRYVQILLQKSFALVIKISFGCTRDFRVKMWGTSSPEDKLAGDLGNVIEATSSDGRRSHFFTA